MQPHQGSAEAWGKGHFTATSILRGRSQAQTLKTLPEPGETQQQLIHLHCEAALEKERKSCRPQSGKNKVVKGFT